MQSALMLIVYLRPFGRSYIDHEDDSQDCDDKEVKKVDECKSIKDSPFYGVK